MKASHKRLNVVLVLGVRNFGPASIVLKLVEFPLFDNFFFNLAKFQDLDIFSLFDFLDLDNFPNFLAGSILFSPILNLLTLMLLLFFIKIGLLLLFLLEADLLPLFLLKASSLSNLVVFSIEVSGATILLNL